MSSPSASVASSCPILLLFSSTEKLEDEVISGVLSFMLIMLTVIFCVAEFTPSLAVIVAV